MGRISTGKGGNNLRKEREKIWKGLKGKGGKDLNGERAKDLKEE